jgi:hypothetical protein
MDQRFKSATEASGLLQRQFEMLHATFGSQADNVQAHGRRAGIPGYLFYFAGLGFPGLQTLHVHPFQVVHVQSVVFVPVNEKRNGGFAGKGLGKPFSSGHVQATGYTGKYAFLEASALRAGRKQHKI